MTPKKLICDLADAYLSAAVPTWDSLNGGQQRRWSSYAVLKILNDIDKLSSLQKAELAYLTKRLGI